MQTLKEREHQLVEQLVEAGALSSFDPTDTPRRRRTVNTLEEMLSAIDPEVEARMDEFLEATG